MSGHPNIALAFANSLNPPPPAVAVREGAARQAREARRAALQNSRHATALRDLRRCIPQLVRLRENGIEAGHGGREAEGRLLEELRRDNEALQARKWERLTHVERVATLASARVGIDRVRHLEAQWDRGNVRVPR